MISQRITFTPIRSMACTAVLALLSGCTDIAQLPPGADMGPNPQLPAPRTSLIPTVNVAPAAGWPEGAKPEAMAGLAVNAFAQGLDHPRWLHVLPNGDVLVAESNKPAKPAGAPGGIKEWLAGLVMKRAGAGVPSANRISLHRDADGDGVAETRSVFLAGLHSPFGMALVGNDFYVANTDAIVRFPYVPGQTQITEPGTKLADLPALPINHHWTKSLIASSDGTKLYATVGSNSNVGENGMEAEAGRAAIWEVDRQSGAHRIFASGLRNPNGMGWAPGTNALWTVVNERDEFGSDLVPDYLTSVRDGAFYGWPYSYYGATVDPRPKPPRPDLVAKAVVPDYALGSHVAPLGMAFANGQALLPALSSGAFVGQHGSWNRRPHSGYNVVFVPFKDGRPNGLPIEVLKGFLSPDGKAYGRPVGVAMDGKGGLLVADDVGNTVWRISAAAR
jgi:glucose/arabinose dehydrogenase